MTKKNTSPFLAHDTVDPYPKIYTPQKRDSTLTRVAKSTKKIFTKRDPDHKIPVTVFTGYLGAGKTTVITHLMKSMPDNYKIAWLKNEIGNTGIDTELANESHVTMTKEMLQGCICHVMVGQLSSALDEMIASNPDRIIIETSGSAAPAPVVFQIRKNDRLSVDGVVTVVDATNFTGYIDKSPTLKMQARYTDLILINKHEGLDEKTLESHLDDLYEINLDTPKILTRRGVVSPNLIFGLDSTLFQASGNIHAGDADHHHQEMEVELIESALHAPLTLTTLKENLQKLPGKKFYRIKGIIHTDQGNHVINCAFGTCTLTPLHTSKKSKPRVVMMGEDLMQHKLHILETFHLAENDLHYTPKHTHH